MRYTEYHAGKAVIKDKNKLSEAMEKLAKLEDMEESGEWIPCSERLPKDRQIVLADIECSIEGRMCIFAYLKIVDYMGRWINADTGFPVLANVVKWTPLPEPYREVTDEENLESRR